MDDEKDPKQYESEVLADAARRAHDEELEMLANIAIIRSTMLGQRDKPPEERGDGKSKQQELERRLRLRMNLENGSGPEAERAAALRQNSARRPVGTDEDPKGGISGKA